MRSFVKKYYISFLAGMVGNMAAFFIYYSSSVIGAFMDKFSIVQNNIFLPTFFLSIPFWFFYIFLPKTINEVRIAQNKASFLFFSFLFFSFGIITVNIILIIIFVIGFSLMRPLVP